MVDPLNFVHLTLNIESYIMNNKRYNILRSLLAVLLLGFSVAATAQERELNGRVVDADGDAVIGAVVNVAEDNKIVLTDADGRFTLKGVKIDDEITRKRKEFGMWTEVKPIGEMEE